MPTNLVLGAGLSVADHEHVLLRLAFVIQCLLTFTVCAHRREASQGLARGTLAGKF